MKLVWNNGTKPKKESKLNIVAGCLFALLALFSIKSLFDLGGRLFSLFPLSACLFAYLVLAAAMFAEIRKPISFLCIGWILLAVSSIFSSTPHSLDSRIWWYTSRIWWHTYEISYAAAMVLVFAAATVLSLLFVSRNAQIAEKAKKVWFLPGILGAVILITDFIFTSIEYGAPFWLRNLTNIAQIAALFLPMLWLAYPNGMPARSHNPAAKAVPEAVSGADHEAQDGYCELWKHVLLLLFTFGIWQFIWIYKTTRYLNRVKGEEYRDPTTKLLLCMFVPFYSIYWIYKSAQRIDKLAAEKSVNSELATMCLVLAIFIPIIALILMQDKINAIAATEQTLPSANGGARANAAPRGFTSVFSSSENLYAEGAPAVICSYGLLKNAATGEVFAQLRLKNIADSTVLAAKVSIVPFDTAQRPLGEEITHEYLDLSVDGGMEFGGEELISLPNPSTRRISVRLTEMIFSDNTIWKDEGAELAPLKKARSLSDWLGDAELAKQYRLIHGERCVQEPVEDRDLWICSCGGINRKEKTACSSCGCLLDALQNPDMDALREEAQRRIAEENTAKKAQAESQKKVMIRTSAVALILIVVFSCLTGYRAYKENKLVNLLLAAIQGTASSPVETSVFDRENYSSPSRKKLEKFLTGSGEMICCGVSGGAAEYDFYSNDSCSRHDMYVSNAVISYKFAGYSDWKIDVEDTASGTEIQFGDGRYISFIPDVRIVTDDVAFFYSDGDIDGFLIDESSSIGEKFLKRLMLSSK